VKTLQIAERLKLAAEVRLNLAQQLAEGLMVQMLMLAPEHNVRLVNGGKRCAIRSSLNGVIKRDQVAH
jgi:hypothetical protein